MHDSTFTQLQSTTSTQDMDRDHRITMIVTIFRNSITICRRSTSAANDRIYNYSIYVINTILSNARV